jgi:hypothetical protein
LVARFLFSAIAYYTTAERTTGCHIERVTYTCTLLEHTYFANEAFAIVGYSSVVFIDPLFGYLTMIFNCNIKQSGREADHSPPSSAKVKNEWSYTSTFPIRRHGMVIS